MSRVHTVSGVRSSPLDLFLALIYRDNITREADALQELLGSADGS
jgi:hypothetical protein